jgi:hypothetical protein
MEKLELEEKLNKPRPLRTDAERKQHDREQMKKYRETHKEKIKGYKDKNKDLTKDYNKEYYNKNKEKYKEEKQCECGRSYPYGGKKRHDATQIHQKLIVMKEVIPEIAEVEIV